MSRRDSDKDKELRPQFKKCGCQYGYKCCCKNNYSAEHSFDLVDQMALEKTRFPGTID